jgi:acetyltransferase-like isoleucine patch superfamily enzyme
LSGFAASAWRTWLQFRLQSARSIVVRLRMLQRGVYIGEGTRIPGGGELAFAPDSSVQRLGVLNARQGAVIRLGERSRIGAFSVISAAQKIDIGEDVLIADRVFISDHQHESRDPTKPVIAQGVGTPDPVHIGGGCWIGIGVCILPGVQLGPGCIVGAGSVVTRSFPRDSVIAGSPARLIRRRLDHGK